MKIKKSHVAVAAFLLSCMTSMAYAYDATRFDDRSTSAYPQNDSSGVDKAPSIEPVRPMPPTILSVEDIPTTPAPRLADQVPQPNPALFSMDHERALLLFGQLPEYPSSAPQRGKCVAAFRNNVLSVFGYTAEGRQLRAIHVLISDSSEVDDGVDITMDRIQNPILISVGITSPTIELEAKSSKDATDQIVNMAFDHLNRGLVPVLASYRSSTATNTKYSFKTERELVCE